MFRFTNDNNDPIVESLKRCARVGSIDNELLDHIALEGLTGVTFSRLCLLMDALIPTLNSCNDNAAQDYLWSIINRHGQRVPGARVQILYLDPAPATPDPPPPPQTSTASHASSKKSIYTDKSIKLPGQTLKWLCKTDWMLHPVQDGHIMGSCHRYTSRVNISEEAATLFQRHGPRGSLRALHKRYDLHNVYLVADQELRRRAILPTTYDPNMDIKLREYACLELIGRTRTHGIVFPNDKTLGRYRILLSAKGLISQFQQTCNTFIIHHIRRFTQFSPGMPIPGAHPFKGVGSAAAAAAAKAGKLAAIKMEAQDEHDGGPGPAAVDGEDQLKPGVASIRATCCHPRRLKSDRDMLKMVYDVIAASRGASMCDIRRKLKIPKHHARNHLKNLANIELIGSHTRIVLDKKTRIYRARHRSSRKSRILTRKKYLKGVRSKWDSVDVRARDLLGNRRSQFSPAEDSLLILCRIAGLLLQPNLCKLSFVVPKQVIRDILHDELYESHDKTSDSLLRRTKFLRRMHSNVMLINELTAELRDDSDIVRLIGIKKELDEETRSPEKLVKLFKQVLRAIRAKLPHLLGLTSSLIGSGPSAGSSGGASLSIGGGASALGAVVAAGTPLGGGREFSSLEELERHFELIDCQVDSTGASGGSGGGGGPMAGSAAACQPPASTLVQLAESIGARDYRLEINKCEGMRTIMLLASCCVSSSFNLDLQLKVPVRVVGLDQDSENFREMFEHAKESKETSRLIANLTTPNPTADSRRALFMLRNALKLQTIDKCGKLADALVVQPCDITFSTRSEHSPMMTFDSGARLVRDFLAKSQFMRELAPKDNDYDDQHRDKRHKGEEAPRTAKPAPEPEPKPEPVKPRRSRRQAARKGEAILDSEEQQQQAEASTSSGSEKKVAGCEALQPTPAQPPPRPLVDLRLGALLETMEAIMSWVSAMPGLELGLLERKLRGRLGAKGRNNQAPAMAVAAATAAHLSELLELMADLELVTRERLCLPARRREPRLFGHQEAPAAEVVVTLVPAPNAYLRYCQLIGLNSPPPLPQTSTS